MLSIINFYGEDKDGFSAWAGPGRWNDPDMLIVGGFGLSLDQARAQVGAALCYILHITCYMLHVTCYTLDGHVGHVRGAPHHVR